MASLREIRRKIKSVKNTQQITKAMKMVSAARMRRAQGAILSARPFAVKLEAMVRDLASLEAAQEAGTEAGYDPHPYFKPGKGAGVGLVFITGDKGLCGSFNANLLREGLRFLARNRDRKVYAAVAGKKGADFLRKLSDVDLEVVERLTGIFPKVGFMHAEILGKAVIGLFEGGKVSEVALIHNEFKSVAAQRVVAKTLLPLPLPEGAPSMKLSDEFLLEPSREALQDALLPRWVKAELYRALLESQAAELAARMNAMDAATKNAGELMDAMTLNLNRTRQALITREIAELVGGAEALAQ